MFAIPAVDMTHAEASAELGISFDRLIQPLRGDYTAHHQMLNHSDSQEKWSIKKLKRKKARMPQAG
jgi:hypothetical protein